MNTASNINSLRGLSSPSPVAGVTPEDAKKKLIIEKGLQQASLNLSAEEKEIAARKLMEGSSNDKVKVGDKEISVDQLAFDVASSLQSLESETSPEEEYFSWIYDAQKIITEMNTGGIEPHEISYREGFLDNLDQREMDMRVIMGLYAKSNSPEAKDRLAFMQVKLAKLMELRSAVKTSTKGPLEARINPQTSDQDREMAQEAVAYLDNFKVHYKDKRLYSDESYKLCIGCAQVLIGLAAVHELSEAEKLKKQRYEELLEEQRQYLQFQRDMGLRTKDLSFEDMQRFNDIQQRLVAHQEIVNLVKLASRPSNRMANEEELEKDQSTREICSAVLEYRHRGKEVPEGILYKLGVKSFVPDYSASEDWLIENSRSETQSDAIKRINILRGRQLAASETKLTTKMSRFDELRFAQLEKVRERAGLVNN